MQLKGNMVRIRLWVRVPTDPCQVSLTLAKVHTFPYFSFRIGAITTVLSYPTRRCWFSGIQLIIGRASKHPTYVGVHRELQVVVSQEFTKDVIAQEISGVALNKDSRTTTTICVQNQYHKQCQRIIYNNPSLSFLNIISFHFSLVFSSNSRKWSPSAYAVLPDLEWLHL